MFVPSGYLLCGWSRNLAFGGGSSTALVATVTDGGCPGRMLGWAGRAIARNCSAWCRPARGSSRWRISRRKSAKGLYLGSLRFRPGLGLGWDYSNRNSQGDADRCFGRPELLRGAFAGIGIRAQARAVVDLVRAAGGGFVYYLNPNYTPNGTGSERDPFDATISLGDRPLRVASLGRDRGIGVGGQRTKRSIGRGCSAVPEQRDRWLQLSGQRLCHGRSLRSL